MATNIGNAYIQIVPSTKGIQKDIDKGLNNSPGSSKPATNWAGNFVKSAGAMIVSGVGEAVKQALDARGEFEQLSGGVEKIFNDMDTSVIFDDASNAYKNLNMSANEYLSAINDVGASFSATMGDAKAYETAKTGMQAIADFASGTGKDVGTLNEKFSMITRSTSSYQSIADQFSGVLPATSAGFLEQAQAAGVLGEEYTKLSEVPIDEYQQAVAQMLEKGVEQLGLTGNTAAESTQTLTGSIAAAKAAVTNFLAGTGTADTMMETLGTAMKQIGVKLGEIGNQFIQAIPTILSKGGEMLTSLCTSLAENAPMLADSAMDLISQFVTFLGANGPQLLMAGIEIIIALVTGIIENLPELLVVAGTAIVTFIKGLVDKFPELKEKAVELFTEMKDKLDQKVEEFLQVGSKIVDKIKEGIANAWNAVSEWLSGLVSNAISNAIAEIDGDVSEHEAQTGGSTSHFSGNFATGLDYVPRDNFPALLHRGEAVLTKSEARSWRGGISMSASNVSPVTIPITLELDGAVIARKTYEYNRKQSVYHGTSLIHA